jgi:hypothetical protein
LNRPGSALLALASCVLLVSTAWSEEIVRRIDWQELAAANALKSGTVVAVDERAGGRGLRLVQEGAGPVTLPLLTMERPGIRTERYALRGRLKYERVAAGGYLELWSYLPEGVFFSRTLAQSGPMQGLEGSSGWRPFVLPFVNHAAGSSPQKLAFNLVLKGAGRVEIGPVELVQFAPDENPLGGSGAWWSGRDAGILGAIGGSALGILGAVVGWLGSAGRAKGFVLNALKAIAWAGLAVFLLGAVAFFSGQPYAVYYSLLLLGGISATLGFFLPRSLGKRYQDLELRRMEALDA